MAHFGGAALARRVERVLGRTDAERAIDAYQQFMELKKNLEDFDAQVLSPPAAIDKVWHLHVLDTRAYAADCQSLCGRMIHHDIDGGQDAAARDKRIASTKMALRARFGDSFDAKMWRFDAGDGAGAVAVKREREQTPQGGAAAASASVSRPQKRARGSISPPAAPMPAEPAVANDTRTIILRLVDQRGEETSFRVKRSSELINVFEAYAAQKGVDRSKLRFFEPKYGILIERFATPEMLDLEDQDQIDVLLEQCGC